MNIPLQIKQQSCMDCLSGQSLGFEIRMAFQPIIDWQQQNIFAYEALVRGSEGQGAGWVFERINDDNKYYFDQSCRVKAIETAARLGCDTLLSINFMPNAIYNPDTCIRATIEAATLYQFDLEKIIFEVIEGEQIVSQNKLKRIFESYARHGFRTAIDDFGAG
ncbi:MAG: EAL domain-containing protein, partial [Oceanisphaera sp.]|nr:EAL domain-containing protein [Oceanisphaera sp.]